METLQKYTNYIVNEKRFSVHTVRAYTDDIASFFSFCNCLTDADLQHLSSSDVRSWLISLAEKKQSPRTYKRKLSSIKAFFKFVNAEGLLQKDPTSGIISPKQSNPIPEFFTEKELINLFEYVNFPNTFTGFRDELILRLFYSTGIRLSELVSLKVTDVDFSLQQISVVGKRKKQRYIPITQKLIGKVRIYLHKRGEVCTTNMCKELFITEKGVPVYPRLIQRVVKKYLQQVTTSYKLHPHKMRHTFATHMLNNGADLNAVKELLGHANLSATEIYTHNTYEKLKSKYNQAHPRA